QRSSVTERGWACSSHPLFCVWNPKSDDNRSQNFLHFCIRDIISQNLYTPVTDNEDFTVMHVLRILPFRLFVIGVIFCTSLIVAARPVPLPLSTSQAVTSIQADAGNYHTCAVRTDGTVACWGWDEYGQSSPPSGTFTSVSAGDIHTCGIRTDGTVSCWGDSTNGKSSPSSGTFTAISAGISHTCAIRADGSVDCW